MSTRFSLRNSRINWATLGVPSPSEFVATPNAVPGQRVWCIRHNPQNERELLPLKWGLVPDWLKDFSQAPSNARLETAAQRPMFKEAWKTRRCVILADSFSLWQIAGADRKTLWSVRIRSNQLMLFAGLWERYTIDDAVFFDSCVMLTMPAVESLQLFSARMPAVLVDNQLSEWLAGDPMDLSQWSFRMNQVSFHCQQPSQGSR